jgi:hypothetical protein
MEIVATNGATSNVASASSTAALIHDLACDCPSVSLSPHPRLCSWPKHEHAGLAPQVPVCQALTTRYATDMHVQPAHVLGLERRLGRAVLDEKLEVVRIGVMFIDVDCKDAHVGKTPITDEWRSDFQRKFERLQAVAPGGFAYFTRGGARITYRFAPVIELYSAADALFWRSYYLSILAYLARKFEIEADPACGDFTRLFRTPHATREGIASPEERGYVGGSPFDLGTWRVELASEDLAAGLSLVEKKLKLTTASSARRLRVARDGITSDVGHDAVNDDGDDDEADLAPATLGYLGLALRARGDLGAAIEPGAWRIRCPFDGVHTTGEAFDSSTVYYGPPEAGLPGFIHCLHAGCIDRSQDEFQASFGRTDLNAARRLARVASHIGHEPTSADLPVIVIDTDEARVNEEACRALARDPSLFAHGGRLVTVGEGTDGMPGVLQLPKPLLRERLAATAQWKTTDRKGELVSAHPPQWTIDALDVRQVPREIPRITRVVTAPILRPDGSVVSSAGWDESTGVYLVADQIVQVPTTPSEAEARAALALLIDLIAEFPADELARSCLVAAMLTPFALSGFRGPLPLFLFNGNGPGVGKSLLVEVVGLLALGVRPSASAYQGSESNQRKAITSIAMSGSTVVWIDNVIGELGGGPLEAAITSSRWSDRVLGESRMFEGPLRLLWLVTSNNARLRSGDILRRILPIRLDSPEERPEKREDFRYPQLLEHVAAHRSELVAAALTILRWYVVAGRPKVTMAAWGSFEDWSACVRAPLIALGAPDPAKARDALEQVADPERELLQNLVEGWMELLRELHQEDASAADAVEALRADEEGARGDYGRHLRALNYQALREAVSTSLNTPLHAPPTAKKLGAILGRYRSRVVDGKRLTAKTVNGTTRWFVETVRAPAVKRSATPSACVQGQSPPTDPREPTGQVSTEQPPAHTEAVRPAQLQNQHRPIRRARDPRAEQRRAEQHAADLAAQQLATVGPDGVGGSR